MSAIDKLLHKLRGLLRCPCTECHQLLFDYVQGNLNADQARRLEKHIGDCPPCLEYVETYRRTIGACREHCQPPAEQMPPELKRKLSDFISQELK